LNTNNDQIITKLESLQNEKKALEKEMERLKEADALNRSKQLLAKAETINGNQIIIERLDGLSAATLKMIGAQLIQNKQKTLIAIGSETQGKVALMIAVSNDLTADFQAGNLVGEIAKITGGGGGGRPDLATAGGKDVTQIDAALSLLKEKVQ